MTAKEKIIELMKYKLWKSQIDRPDCPDYYVKADFDDVRGWSNCEEVWERINRVPITLGDALTCAHCIFFYQIEYRPLCENCSYGQRHGICCTDHRDDTYSQHRDSCNDIHVWKGLEIIIPQIEVGETALEILTEKFGKEK